MNCIGGVGGDVVGSGDLRRSGSGGVEGVDLVEKGEDGGERKRKRRS